MNSDTETPGARVRRFVTLTQRKRELESALKSINAEIDALEEVLTEQFASEGEHSRTIHLEDGSKFTVYLQQVRYPRVVDGDYPRAIEALRRLGASDLEDNTQQ